MSNKKIVLVFGVFDTLHDGHRYFLREAKKWGDLLVVALAPDTVVETLKKRLPKQGFNQRKKALQALVVVDKVIEGDSETENWAILKKVDPDVVALGYDQKNLKHALHKYLKNKENKGFLVTSIKPYKPRVFHSRLLKNVDK